MRVPGAIVTAFFFVAVGQCVWYAILLPLFPIEDNDDTSSYTPCHTTSSAAAIENQTEIPAETDKKKTKKDCIVFWHVPKTGGTTIDWHLKHFAESVNWTFTNWQEHLARR